MFSQWPPEPFYSGPPEDCGGVHMSGSTHDHTSVSLDAPCFLHDRPDVLNIQVFISVLLLQACVFTAGLNKKVNYQIGK